MISSFSVARLEIYLLGSFQVKINGVPVRNKDWQRRSSVKLVKLLALAPEHSLHRDQIIELLWADQYSENLTNNLNKAIHAARRVFEPELSKPSDSQYIISENQKVALRAPENKLFIDAREFEILANSGIKTENLNDCEAALALYKGDLLNEDLYEDWTVSRREHLRLLHRKLVTKTAEIYARRERFERSVELLKKISLSDPTDERVHQELMRLYAMTGSKYQALKQFEVCRKALSEIGFQPEPKTLEIKEQIRSGKIEGVKKSVEDSDAADHKVIKDGGLQANDLKVEPRIKRLTFNHGVVQSARFLPGGENIIYSAAWEENDFKIYKIHRENLESVPTGISDAGIFSVSPVGEIAVSLRRRFERGYKSIGTLAQINFSNAVPPRELIDKIEWAEWRPESGGDPKAATHALAVVRNVNGRNQLEYPIGNIICKTGGWFSHLKFLPPGDKIAFINHPTLDDDSGEIVVVNLAGEKTVLSGKWISAQGLVWNKARSEIWFTATREGNSRAIYGVDLAGNERLVYKGTGSITIHDLADDGAALITSNKTQIKIAAKISGDAKERDLTWHDWSLVRDIAPDGSTILFTEAGESGGTLYAAFVRNLDGTNTVRLGEGSALAFSPDGKHALVKLGTTPQRLAIYTIATGERKLLEGVNSETFFYQPWAGWFPGGEKIIFAANEADKGTRLYTQEIGGAAVCLTPDREGFEISTPRAISPDGKAAAIIHPNRRIYLYEFETGELKSLPDLPPNYLAIGWSADGTKLFVRERGRVPAVVYGFELKTGKIERMYELYPQYPTGVFEILRVLITPDESAYAYSYTREFSDLLFIEGLQ